MISQPSILACTDGSLYTHESISARFHHFNVSHLKDDDGQSIEPQLRSHGRGTHTYIPRTMVIGIVGMISDEIGTLRC